MFNYIDLDLIVNGYCFLMDKINIFNLQKKILKRLILSS